MKRGKRGGRLRPGLLRCYCERRSCAVREVFIQVKPTAPYPKAYLCPACQSEMTLYGRVAA